MRVDKTGSYSVISNSGTGDITIEKSSTNTMHQTRNGWHYYSHSQKPITFHKTRNGWNYYSPSISQQIFKTKTGGIKIARPTANNIFKTRNGWH